MSMSPSMTKSPSVVKSPYTTKKQRRESDLKSLQKERKDNKFPLTKPPFRKDGAPKEPKEKESEDEREIEAGELECIAPDEVLWIDLLLEISMTTAFASLTDETPVLQWNDGISYICFFTFVWWIWVAQVAYNMRFRQADWLHRVWVFFQLVVFSALSAFTRDFDITFGLTGIDPNEAQRVQLMSNLGNDYGRLATQTFRDERLPRVNARGISMVLGLSRLLLLAQYVVVFFHARDRKPNSILIHIGTLMFSSLCYFGAFIILGSSGQQEFGTPTPSLEIAKLVLWSLPIVVEMLSHFVALRFSGFVRYSTKSVSTRNATIFIIILGGGLDKITSGFSDFVGNIGLKVNAIPLFLATAAIFICLFALYFSTPGSTRKLSNRRALLWFMSQGLFLGPLLITLQAIAQSLQFSNLHNAIQMGASSLNPIFDHMRDFPDENVTMNMFPDAKIVFDRMGLSFPFAIDQANLALVYQQDINTSISTHALQQSMDIVYCVLETLDALPDVGSLLWAKANTFLTVNMTNSTVLTQANYNDIRTGIILDRGSSQMWFFPAAGASVLALVFMAIIRGTPRDKWEFAIAGVRTVFGTGICLLALFDIDRGDSPILTPYAPSGSKIWALLLGPTQWPLLILAIVLVTLRVFEHIIAFAADRTYMSTANIPIPSLRRHTQEYQRTARHDRDSLASDGGRYSFTGRKSTETLYDPYEDVLEDSKVSRHTSPSNSVDHEGDDRTLHGDEY